MTDSNKGEEASGDVGELEPVDKVGLGDVVTKRTDPEGPNWVVVNTAGFAPGIFNAIPLAGDQVMPHYPGTMGIKDVGAVVGHMGIDEIAEMLTRVRTRSVGDLDPQALAEVMAELAEMPPEVRRPD